MIFLKNRVLVAIVLASCLRDICGGAMVVLLIHYVNLLH